MSCTICLVNKIYHEVVLRLRSSGSVLERDEGKEEKGRIFTVHRDKHALLFKLPEMIAAYFFGKSKHPCNVKIVQYVCVQYFMLHKKAAVLRKSSSTTMILMKRLARRS